MQRVQSGFAVAAVVMLVLGLLDSHGALGSGLSVLWGRRTFGVPNRMLCYGSALAFTFFALLYSFWFVPWSAQAARWHLGLSVLAAAVFGGTLLAFPRVAASHETSGRMLALLILFTASPFVFLLIQGWYLIDALRRCWAVFARG
jgi:hypothetical protein